MDIARVDKTTGLVVNIECASQEWLDAHADDPEYTFVAYTEDAPAAVGHAWDGSAFVPPEATITVTVKVLADAGLDAKAIETLSKS